MRGRRGWDIRFIYTESKVSKIPQRFLKQWLGSKETAFTDETRRVCAVVVYLSTVMLHARFVVPALPTWAEVGTHNCTVFRYVPVACLLPCTDVLYCV